MEKILSMPQEKRMDSEIPKFQKPHCYDLTSDMVPLLEKKLCDTFVNNNFYHPPIFPGCIGVDGKVLESAGAIALAFYRACGECAERAHADVAFMEQLLAPFGGYPSLLKSIATLPFFMKFFRIDFYLEPISNVLKIIEVNTAPGAFPEHAVLDAFWGSIVDCSPPGGWVKAEPIHAIKVFHEYAQNLGHPARTIGLIARDDGEYAGFAEAKLFAQVIREQTTMKPVLCTIEGGRTLELFPGIQNPITTIDDLDLLYHNPSGTLAVRDAFSAWLEEHHILLLPPRSNLLFTNKSFLCILSEHLDELHCLSSQDKILLRSALLPSFPASEVSLHEKAMRTWDGVVVKRNLGSSGKQVYIWDRDTMSPDNIFRELRNTVSTMHDGGMVQELARTSSIEHKGERTFFDIMTYVVMSPRPSILFATRPFRGMKANIFQGAEYGQLYCLPTRS
jgi:hypothetical protein